MSTLKTTNLQNASSATTNITLNTDGTTSISTLSGNPTVTGTLAMGSSFLRNRIINGDMRIDQRNAGASVTVNSTSAFYAVDRWQAQGQSTDGVFTLQQSSTAPADFKNSIVATVTTVDSSLGATQYYLLSQRIEGNNLSDLNWGSANAKTITISFWVRSSVTGTFGGSLVNSALNRSYPFTYTIGSTQANQWVYQTVTIPGDTNTGATWLTDNGIGVIVYFALGVGSTYSGTANNWGGSFYASATGATNLMATNGATFYITGVQLEVGSVATPFERRQYGQELALCQRYYVRYVPGTNGNSSLAVGRQQGTTSSRVSLFYSPMRANPTATNSGGIIAFAGGGTAITAITTQYLSVQNGFIDVSHAAVGATGNCVSIEISGANFFELAAEL